MKISCQSCQAKYTIADEKVLGKIVKIRCKKCGATIVVNGSDRVRRGGATPTSRVLRLRRVQRTTAGRSTSPTAISAR